MRNRYRDDFVLAPKLPEPEVVKVRVILIHGASGRCEQITQDADYTPVLVDPQYRDKLLSDLGRRVAIKMTGVKEEPTDQPLPGSLRSLFLLDLQPPTPDAMPLTPDLTALSLPAVSLSAVNLSNLSNPSKADS